MDEPDVSRRTLLGGLALASGAGAVVGAGTGAVLSDGATFAENHLTAGALDLRVEWGGNSSEGDASVGIDLSDENASGERLFTVSLPDDGANNPAYAWLGATCPDPNPLAGSFYVTLSRVDCETGAATAELAAGRVHEVADELANGIPLDADGTSTSPGSQSCLEPGDELCLRLEWYLDQTYEGEDELDFDLRFVGTQCRHADGGTSPFSGEECGEPPTPDRRGISFVEIYTCEGGDEPVGKLELEDDYCGADYFDENSIEPGEYALYDDDCDETGYVVRVTETVAKEDGETVGIAFELLDDAGGPGPDLCRVDVKGGTETVTYGTDSLDGNATGGLLLAPIEGGGHGGSP